MSTMRPWLTTTAAALVVVGIVAAISVMVQSGQPVVEPPQPNPTALPTNSRTDGPAQPKDVTVPVYFLGDTAQGTRLFREFRRYQGVAGWSKLRIAVNGAILGDTTDPDYRSGFPKGTSAQVSLGPSTVTVDLRGDDDLTVRRADAEITLQAIVHTVDGVLQASTPVEFEIDGARASTVLGVDTAQPLTRAATDDVQAPVWVVDPSNESTVDSPFTVTGQAATSEANVQWELKDGDRAVRRGFTTADECCTTSPYSFTVTAPPGTYTLVVHDTDESGGGTVNADTKEVTVR
jgi:hypothetical protein